MSIRAMPPLQRFLILHPESDSYFEVFGEASLEEALANGETAEVTDDPVHEQLFQLYRAKK
jgi:hypothetical protein